MTDFTSRQKEIIEASIRIIADGGIQELTTKNLSRLIGLSEPALYRHFDNKLAILQAVLDYFADRSRAMFDRAVGSKKPGMEQLREVLTAHFEQFARQPALSAVLFSEELFQNYPQLSKAVLNIMSTSQGYLRRIIQGGTERREFRGDVPVDHLALVIMGALRLIVTRWHLSGYGFDLREEGRSLWESLGVLLSPARAADGGGTGG